MSNRYEFLITLRVEQHDATQEEATRALRAFLKAALRSYGLRCTSAREITAAADSVPPASDESAV